MGLREVSKLLQGRRKLKLDVDVDWTYDDDSLAQASEEGYSIPQPGEKHCVK